MCLVPYIHQLLDPRQREGAGKGRGRVSEREKESKNPPILPFPVEL